jgi:hypothetical protein
MTIFNTNNKSIMLSIITNKMEGKNKFKMDLYDVHVQPIKFHLYDKESSWTFNFIKNILKYNTILFISKEEFEETKRVIRICKSKQNIQHNGQKNKYKRTNIDIHNIHIKLKIDCSTNPTKNQGLSQVLRKGT